MTLYLELLFVVVEYVVRALLEGDVEASYTEADNASVVATDTGTAVAIITSPSYTLLITLYILHPFSPPVKNTIYILAKTSPHVLTAELFALHLATHFVTKYPHIHKAFVDIDSLRWSRIEVSLRLLPLCRWATSG